MAQKNQAFGKMLTILNREKLGFKTINIDTIEDIGNFLMKQMMALSMSMTLVRKAHRNF